LNRYPRLKQVLYQELGVYENIQVEFSGGAPTAYFLDSQGTVVSSTEIGDKNIQELFSLFKQYDFTPRKKSIPFPETPSIVGEFGGHYYEVYNHLNYYHTSKEVAESKTYNGQKGYLLTLTCAKEEEFILNLIQPQGINGVWLGAQDVTEQEWQWLDGAEEKDKIFFSGNSNVGVIRDNMYANWKQGEPNNADNEDCAVLFIDGWNDVVCNTSMFIPVIEYGSAPNIGCQSTTEQEAADIRIKPVSDVIEGINDL